MFFSLLRVQDTQLKEAKKQNWKKTFMFRRWGKKIYYNERNGKKLQNENEEKKVFHVTLNNNNSNTKAGGFNI